MSVEPTCGDSCASGALASRRRRRVSPRVPGGACQGCAAKKSRRSLASASRGTPHLKTATPGTSRTQRSRPLRMRFGSTSPNASISWPSSGCHDRAGALQHLNVSFFPLLTRSRSRPTSSRRCGRSPRATPPSDGSGGSVTRCPLMPSIGYFSTIGRAHCTKNDLRKTSRPSSLCCKPAWATIPTRSRCSNCAIECSAIHAYIKFGARTKLQVRYCPALAPYSRRPGYLLTRRLRCSYQLPSRSLYKFRMDLAVSICQH